MYELEAQNSGTASTPKDPSAKTPQSRSSTSLHKVKSFGGWSSGDGKKASCRSRRTSHSVISTCVDTWDGRYNEELEIQEEYTMVGKLSALAKTPMTEWQGWKNKRAEKLLSEKQPTKSARPSGGFTSSYRGNPGFCSCGPPGSCELEKAAKAEEAHAAAAAQDIKENTRSSRRAMSVFGRTHSLVSRKSSNRKSLGKGKEKEVDTAMDDAPQQPPCDIEEDTTSSVLPRIPWHPEFQYKPRPSSNCLLLKPDHGFSDREIQKMRWFVDRMARGLAVPEDWFEEDTQSAGEREARRWNKLHPLNPWGLVYSPPFPSKNSQF